MATKKRKTPLQSKLKISLHDKWDSIINDVAKPDVPIDLLDRMVVHLIDGTKVDVNILGLLSEGGDPDVIDQHIQLKLYALDAYIDDIDLYVNIQEVAKTVQPVTDRLLSKL